MRYIIVLLLLISASSFAQETEREKKLRFGLGASFFSLGELAYEHEGFPAPSFHLMLDVGKHLRLEPTVAFSVLGDIPSERTIWINEPPSYIVTTIGVFGKKIYPMPGISVAKFFLLYGLRGGAVFSDSDDHKLLLAPTLAGELLLFDHFSLGCDLSIRQLYINPGLRHYTNTMAVLRFYF